MELLEKSTFLRALFEEVEHFDSSLFPPLSAPVKNGEKVIGECPEYLRKFYALAQMFSREKDRLAVENKYTPKGAPGEAEILRQLYELNTKEDLLREILWAALRAELNSFEEQSIGLREDWKVVTYSRRGPQDFIDFIRERLGS